MTQRQKQKLKYHTFLSCKYILLCALIVLFVGPFAWLLSISLRGSENIYSLRLIPEDPTIKNFSETWTKFNLYRPFHSTRSFTGWVFYIRRTYITISIYFGKKNIADRCIFSDFISL